MPLSGYQKYKKHKQQEWKREYDALIAVLGIKADDVVGHSLLRGMFLEPDTATSVRWLHHRIEALVAEARAEGRDSMERLHDQVYGRH